MTEKKIVGKISIVTSTESGTALVIAIDVTEIVTGTVIVTAGMTGVMTGTEMIVTETGTGGERIVTDTIGTETTGEGRRKPAILTSLRRILTMTRHSRRVSATKTRHSRRVSA